MGQKLIVEKGLFTEKVDAILGQKCRACNRVLPPLTTMCCECFNENLEPVPLGKKGRIFSYTIVQVPVKTLQPPYAVAWIEMPEGVTITSLIKGWQEKPISIGDEVEMVIEKLYEEGGDDIIGYKFQPV